MRSFHIALMGFNKLGIHFILSIFSLCVYVKNTQSTSPNGELSQVSGRLYLFLFQRKLYVLFKILYVLCKLGLCIKTLEKRVLLFMIIFLPLKGSLTLFQIRIFLLYYHLFFPIWSYISRIELPKLTSNIFMEIVTIPVVAVDQLYFYQHQPIKPWLFEKIIL